MMRFLFLLPPLGVRKTRDTHEAGAVVPNPLNTTLKDGVQKETKIDPAGQQNVATAIKIKAVTPQPAVDEDDGIQVCVCLCVCLCPKPRSASS